MVRSAEEEEYAAFEEKVRKSVLVDNLSTTVTEFVLRSALDQFRPVVNIFFIPNYFQPNPLFRAALVEMKNSEHAEDIIQNISDSPFMITRMPRPVRALPAEAHLFADRPTKPNKSLKVDWIYSNHPQVKVLNELKTITRKHEVEASFYLNAQLAMEEKLVIEKSKMLKAHYRKYEIIEHDVNDGRVVKLGECYNMKIDKN